MTFAQKSLPLLFGLMWAALVAANSDRKVVIMFDPARDGPILAEPRRAASVPLSGGTCTTSLSTDGGRSSMPVFTPCSTMSSSSSSLITTTTTTGGTHVQQR